MPDSFYEGSVALRTDEIDLVVIEANPIQQPSLFILTCENQKGGPFHEYKQIQNNSYYWFSNYDIAK